MMENNKEYFNLLNDIKNTLNKTKIRVINNANKELILMYYNIGKKLLEHNKWGNSFIDTLAKDIKIEFPDIKGMSARNLRYMQKFASTYNDDEFLQEVLANLSWNHNQLILDKVKELKKQKWYAKKSLENGWSTTVMVHQIELKLYERQAVSENKTENFKETFYNSRRIRFIWNT